jgi:hypothetical protein
MGNCATLRIEDAGLQGDGDTGLHARRFTRSRSQILAGEALEGLDHLLERALAWGDHLEMAGAG